MENSMNFQTWVAMMRSSVPAFKDCLMDASSGRTPDQWRNYFPDPEWQRPKDRSADDSISEVLVTSEERVVITQFEQVRQLLHLPALEHLAMLAMLGTDQQLRVYGIMDCGDEGLYIKVMMGAPDSTWASFRTTNERRAAYLELFTWLASRPNVGYVPRPISGPDQLIAQFGTFN